MDLSQLVRHTVSYVYTGGGEKQDGVKTMNIFISLLLLLSRNLLLYACCLGNYTILVGRTTMVNLTVVYMCRDMHKLHFTSKMFHQLNHLAK